MLRRRAGRPVFLAMAAVSAVAVAACSSSSSSAPKSHQSLADARSIDAGALLAQCALTRDIHGLLASAQAISSSLPASRQWLHGSQILLTRSNAADFSGWFEGHAAGVVVQGRRLEDWERYAGQHGKLPVAVCGAGVSARSLHDQIYARYPSLRKNNPWGS